MSIAVIEHATTETTELRRLAETINREHALALAAFEDARSHAILVGEALIATKQLVVAGEWVRWIASNLPFSEGQAQRYMRIAAHKDALSTQPQSINGALKDLKRLGLTGPIGAPARYDISMRDEAKTLIAQGASYTEAAAELGVSRGAIQTWVNPDARKKSQREASQKRRQQRSAERAAFERERLSKLAKKRGGDVSSAWTNIHLITQTLDRAIGQEADPVARAALNDALQLAYKLEYKIDEAVRTSKAKR